MKLSMLAMFGVVVLINVVCLFARGTAAGYDFPSYTHWVLWPVAPLILISWFLIGVLKVRKQVR